MDKRIGGRVTLIRYAYSQQMGRETWRKEDNKVYKPYVVCL